MGILTGYRGWQPAENSLKWGEVTCSLRPFYVCAYLTDKNTCSILSTHKSLTFALIHIKWKYRVPFLTWSVFVSSRRAWLCYILIHNLTWAVSWFRGSALFQRGKNSSAQEIIFFCALFIINSKTLFKKQTAFSKSTMQKCDACLGLFLFAVVWEMNQDPAVLLGRR